MNEEVKKAYRRYQAIHRQCEAGENGIEDKDVHRAFSDYLSLHSQFDAPEGYEPYSPYEIAQYSPGRLRLMAERQEAERQGWGMSTLGTILVIVAVVMGIASALNQCGAQ